MLAKCTTASKQDVAELHVRKLSLDFSSACDKDHIDANPDDEDWDSLSSKRAGADRDSARDKVGKLVTTDCLQLSHASVLMAVKQEQKERRVDVLFATDINKSLVKLHLYHNTVLMHNYTLCTRPRGLPLASHPLTIHACKTISACHTTVQSARY